MCCVCVAGVPKVNMVPIVPQYESSASCKDIVCSAESLKAVHEYSTPSGEEILFLVVNLALFKCSNHHLYGHTTHILSLPYQSDYMCH